MNGLPVKKRVFVGILDPKQFNSAVALTSRLSGTCYRTVRRWQSLHIAVSALNFTPQFACLCLPAVRANDPWSYGLRFLFTSLKWFFGSRDALQITCFTSYPLLRFDLSRVEIVSKERNDKIIEKGLMCQNISPFSLWILHYCYLKRVLMHFIGKLIKLLRLIIKM